MPILSQVEGELHRFSVNSITPMFWRRRFGTVMFWNLEVLTPTIWHRNVLVQKSFGADAFLRKYVWSQFLAFTVRKLVLSWIELNHSLTLERRRI